MDTKDVETQFKNVGLHDREELEKLGFFDTDQECEAAIKRTYLEGDPQELDIIIEFTQQCNLRCPYCYQSTWGRKGEISTETLDYLLVYIRKCFQAIKYKSLRLSLFGGEPLLQQEKLFYIYKKINELCKQYNVRLTMLRPLSIC